MVVLSTMFFLSPAKALPVDFKTMYVFGDSLSDIGNIYSLNDGAVPPSAQPELRYYSGQFSNGKVVAIGGVAKPSFHGVTNDAAGFAGAGGVHPEFTTLLAQQEITQLALGDPGFEGHIA